MVSLLYLLHLSIIQAFGSVHHLLVFLKEIVMAVGLLVQLVFLGYFTLREADEQADELLYANLSKAAMTAFASSIVVLLTLALLLTNMKVARGPRRYLFIVAGVLVLLFNFVSMYLESRGA